jgi:hypothetical protein
MRKTIQPKSPLPKSSNISANTLNQNIEYYKSLYKSAVPKKYLAMSNETGEVIHLINVPFIYTLNSITEDGITLRGVADVIFDFAGIPCQHKPLSIWKNRTIIELSKYEVN